MITEWLRLGYIHTRAEEHAGDSPIVLLGNPAGRLFPRTSVRNAKHPAGTHPPGAPRQHPWTFVCLSIPQVGRAGLEPAKAEPADLQSAPFAARDTDPSGSWSFLAGDGTRTHNLLITSQLLCQLSYAGAMILYHNHLEGQDAALVSATYLG